MQKTPPFPEALSTSLILISNVRSALSQGFSRADVDYAALGSSSQHGAGMLEAGSLAGNDSAKVSSSALSRTMRCLFSEIFCATA